MRLKKEYRDKIEKLCKELGFKHTMELHIEMTPTYEKAKTVPSGAKAFVTIRLNLYLAESDLELEG
jgi:hypothetical protein